MAAALHLWHDDVDLGLVERTPEGFKARVFLVEIFTHVVDEGPVCRLRVDAAVLPRKEPQPVDRVDGELVAGAGVGRHQGVTDDRHLVAAVAHGQPLDDGVVVRAAGPTASVEERQELARLPSAGLLTDGGDDGVAGGCGEEHGRSLARQKSSGKRLGRQGNSAHDDTTVLVVLRRRSPWIGGEV